MQNRWEDFSFAVPLNKAIQNGRARARESETEKSNHTSVLSRIRH